MQSATQEILRVVQEGIKGNTAKASYVVGDASREEDVIKLFDQTVEQYGEFNHGHPPFPIEL